MITEGQMTAWAGLLAEVMLRINRAMTHDELRATVLSPSYVLLKRCAPAEIYEQAQAAAVKKADAYKVAP
jgi:hypothetical protein